MEEVSYIGEHIWLGQLGHFAIVAAFVSAICASWAYYKSLKGESSWLSIGKTAYITHGISIFIAIALLLYAMVSHYYEYDYVFRTVSDSSQMKYLLAAFWADQEGSFLLWMFWHVILGWIFIAKGKSWTAPTMVTLALIQVFLTSMLLGVFIPFLEEDFKIGSNPFILVRDVYLESPIFTRADYLTQIEGRGLNPLLQNYWMTIHPPVLFLGFASVSIPFSMAVAGLSSDKHIEILKPLLKWGLFSAFILGLGILMGAAWAYEALTFGGYWAWDPVENTSLVPWLILVAGIHTNLIAKSTKYSIKSTYAYYLLAFIMILYSTFLTRSGILGDTSVHAFTTMGLETQLASFIIFFVGLGLYKYITRHKTIPVKPNEENIYSREFWMFVGALVLFFSGLLMTGSTSLPVYNKIVELFDPYYIPIAIDDPMAHHNKFQIWIGIFMGLLAGTAILLRYHAANWKNYKAKLSKYLLAVVTVTALLTFLLHKVIDTYTWQHYVFLFAGLFTIIANGTYIVSFLKGNLKLSGAAFSHIGFGILILGIMFSGLNQKTITAARFLQSDFADGQAEDRAVILLKNQPFPTTDYWINYNSDTLVDNLRYYELLFSKVNSDNEIIESFTSYPSVLYDRDFTKIAAHNPGNNRNWTYDVFTAASPPPHLTDIEIAKQMDDSLKFLSHIVNIGQEIEEEKYNYVVQSPIYNYNFGSTKHSDSSRYDLTVGIPMDITIKRTGETKRVVPGLAMKNALVFEIHEVIDELGIKIKLPDSSFAKIFTEEDKLEYQEIQLENGGTTNWNGYKITLQGFDRSGNYENYQAKEGDIAIAGILNITTPKGQRLTQKPVFILRNAQQFSIDDYDPKSGLHIRFSNIDPETQQMTFRLAQDDRSHEEIEILIANDVPRSDILIVESNIFPGINLVWLGCLMMLGGLLMSLLYKKQQSKA